MKSIASALFLAVAVSIALSQTAYAQNWLPKSAMTPEETNIAEQIESQRVWLDGKRTEVNAFARTAYGTRIFRLKEDGALVVYSRGAKEDHPQSLIPTPSVGIDTLKATLKYAGFKNANVTYKLIMLFSDISFSMWERKNYDYNVLDSFFYQIAESLQELDLLGDDFWTIGAAVDVSLPPPIVYAAQTSKRYLRFFIDVIFSLKTQGLKHWWAQDQAEKTLYDLLIASLGQDNSIPAEERFTPEEIKIFANHLLGLIDGTPSLAITMPIAVEENLAKFAPKILTEIVLRKEFYKH